MTYLLPAEANCVFIDGPVSIFVHVSSEKEILEAIERLEKLVKVAAKVLHEKGVWVYGAGLPPETRTDFPDQGKNAGGGLGRSPIQGEATTTTKRDIFKEAKELAGVLRGMVECGGAPDDLWERDQPDGDPFVARAAELLEALATPPVAVGPERKALIERLQAYLPMVCEDEDVHELAHCYVTARDMREVIGALASSPVVQATYTDYQLSAVAWPIADAIARNASVAPQLVFPHLFLGLRKLLPAPQAPAPEPKPDPVHPAGLSPESLASSQLWIITAPDGRQWHGESPLRACAAAQRDTIDPVLAMQRINAIVDEENAIRDAELAESFERGRQLGMQQERALRPSGHQETS